MVLFAREMGLAITKQRYRCFTSARTARGQMNCQVRSLVDISKDPKEAEMHIWKMHVTLHAVSTGKP